MRQALLYKYVFIISLYYFSLPLITPFGRDRWFP